MRLPTCCLGAVLSLVAAVPSTYADLIVTIDNIVITGSGGQFDVRVTATPGSSHDIDAYGLKLNATLFNGPVSPITFPSETNLLAGFTVIDANPSTTISVTNAMSNNLPSTPDTVGYNALNLGSFITLNAADMNPANDSANFGRFQFQVAGGSFDLGEFWDVGFVTANVGVDTGFSRAGVNIPYTAIGARLAAVPEPSSLAVLGVAGVFGLYWRKRKTLWRRRIAESQAAS